MVLEVIDVNFEELVFKLDKLVVVDFWVEWCGFCWLFGLIIEEMLGEYDGKVVVVKVNVDENLEVFVCFNICNIFIVIFVKNGEIVDKLVGVVLKM